LVWLQAAQPKFFEIFSKSDFLSFSNLNRSDFDDQFDIQEVSTGSAFVIVPLNSKKALANLRFDLTEMNEWLQWHCKTNHRAMYLYCFEDEKLYSRMFCIENNQLVEDAATGSASSCLQAYLLKYKSPEIAVTNHQGEFVNRPSAIYFEGNKDKDSFEIRIGGQTQFIAKGEWEV
jgi:trans-2,3-dihydro-3-hydroxyanthranilate isomerase